MKKALLFILLLPLSALAQRDGVSGGGTLGDFHYGERIRCEDSTLWICKSKSGCYIEEVLQSLGCQVFERLDDDLDQK